MTPFRTHQNVVSRQHSATSARRSHCRSERGAALGLTLTVILIVSMIIAATIPFTLSHLNLAYVDQRYADALFLAEAGVNYEIQQMNKNVNFYPPTNHTQQSPYIITFDSNRNSRVYLEPITYPFFKITGIGTSHGVQRRVQVKVAGRPIETNGLPSGYWNLMGIESLDLKPHMIVQDEHPVGTAGIATGNPASRFNGNFYLLGNASSPTYASQAKRFRDPFPFPTVEEVANQRANFLTQRNPPFTGREGMEWFRTTTDAVANTYNGLNARILVDGVNVRQALINNNYILDKNVFGGNDTPTITLENNDPLGRTANFYLRGVNTATIGQKEGKLLIPNSNTGPVALWIDNWSVPARKEDNFIINFVSNSVTEPTMFRVYYNGYDESSKLKLTLNSDTLPYIYAVKGTVELGGNGNIKGSIIASHIILKAGAQNITFPKTQTPPGYILPEPGTPDQSLPPFPQGEPVGFYISWEWVEVNPR